MSIRCEQTAAALTTGGPVRRWRALRHAARCPACAAIRDELAQVAQALAGVPTLTESERRLWTSAATDVGGYAGVRQRAWGTRLALAGSLLALVTGVVVGWLFHGPTSGPGPGRPAVVVVKPPLASPGTPLEDVASLRGGVVALTHELDELSRRADLLEARRQVDALMAQLAPRGGSSGL